MAARVVLVLNIPIAIMTPARITEPHALIGRIREYKQVPANVNAHGETSALAVVVGQLRTIRIVFVMMIDIANCRDNHVISITNAIIMNAHCTAIGAIRPIAWITFVVVNVQAIMIVIQIAVVIQRKTTIILRTVLNANKNYFQNKTLSFERVLCFCRFCLPLALHKQFLYKVAVALAGYYPV